MTHLKVIFHVEVSVCRLNKNLKLALVARVISQGPVCHLYDQHLSYILTIEQHENVILDEKQ